MNPLAFMPGFDGDAALREGLLQELRRDHEVAAVSYPNRALGTLDEYRVAAMSQVPVDWRPVLVAESFSGLVATRWAAVDSRVQALVLCGAFARNPMGLATHLGASLPTLVRLGPSIMDAGVRLSGDAARRRWSAALSRTVSELKPDVVAERLRMIATEENATLLAKLSIPVVVVSFDDDLVVGPEAREVLVGACARPHVVRLPGPHFALETRPRECAEAIVAALRAVLPADPRPT